MKVTRNIDTGDEKQTIRTISTKPKEHFEGRWKSGRLYPLYSVVVNNGTTFISQNAKMKEEPYVIYDADKKEFKAPDGWLIKEMSADSRVTALGGGGEGGVTPEEVEEMIKDKVDKVDGKGLSTNDYDNTEKNKVASAYQKPNNGIPKSDLAKAVQDVLDDADGAYKKPVTGIPFADLADGVQDSLSNADEAKAGLAGKQDTIQDLPTIRSGAAAGATAYQKPGAGVPKTDLASGVQSSLDLADSSVQAEPVGPIIAPPETDEFATKTQVNALGSEMDKNYKAGAYLDKNDAEVSNAAWGYSDYIPYTTGEVIWRWNDDFSSVTGPSIVMYNAQKVKIDYWGASSASASVGGRRLASIPAGTAYIRCSFKLGENCYLYTNGERAWSPIDSIKGRVSASETELSGLEEKTGGLVNTTLNPTWESNSFPVYETGVISTSPQDIQSATINVKGVISLTAFICGDGATAAAFAFYSSENPSRNSYISSGSIKAPDTRYLPGPGSWMTVPVPVGALVCVVSNRHDFVSSPVVKAVSVPTLETITNNIKKKVDYVPSIFWRKPFYAHFAPANIIRDGYNRKSIPSESLDEIRMAARLGFDFVEANIHVTSDNEFVCFHGEAGDVFGSEFIDLNGGDTSSMVVAQTSMDYIRQYIRYNSDIPKYQVAPPTLDEFIQCCKENNIGLFVGTNMQAAIQKCIDVLNDRLIVYGPPANIRTFFKGHLYFWNNRSTDTAESLLATVREYGKPAICAVGPTSLEALKNNNELETLVASLHADGFFYGGAAVYQTEKETQEDFIRLGADCLGSGHQVNEFEANLKVVDLDGDASDFNLGNATISDNVITMAAGDIITFGPTQELSLGKCWLSVKFNGQVSINFGSVTTRSGLVGDGVSETILSDFLLHKSALVRIVAETATVITGLVYKVSVC